MTDNFKQGYLRDATGALVVAGPGGVAIGGSGSALPSYGGLFPLTSSRAPGANVVYGVRITVPKAGFLRDLAVPFNSGVGSAIVGVYDTGQATAGVRTRLWQSAGLSVTSLAVNTNHIIGDPNLAVTAGQQLDLAVQPDLATVTFLSIAAAAPYNLPASYGTGVIPKLKWEHSPGSTGLAATIAEADAVAGAATIIPVYFRISV